MRRRPGRTPRSPTRPATHRPLRDMRGGAFGSGGFYTRSAMRFSHGRDVRDRSVGFRVACGPAEGRAGELPVDSLQAARILIDLGRREAEQGRARRPTPSSPAPRACGPTTRSSSSTRAGGLWAPTPRTSRPGARRSPSPTRRGRSRGSPRSAAGPRPASLAANRDRVAGRCGFRRGVRAVGAHRGLCPGRALVDDGAGRGLLDRLGRPVPDLAEWRPRPRVRRRRGLGDGPGHLPRDRRAPAWAEPAAGEGDQRAESPAAQPPHPHRPGRLARREGRRAGAGRPMVRGGRRAGGGRSAPAGRGTRAAAPTGDGAGNGRRPRWLPQAHGRCRRPLGPHHAGRTAEQPGLGVRPGPRL